MLNSRSTLKASLVTCSGSIFENLQDLDNDVLLAVVKVIPKCVAVLLF